MRFLYDDPGQTRPLDSWAGTLPESGTIRVWFAIPCHIREAELECVLKQTPSVGSAEYGADLPRLQLRMQAWSQCPSLRFFLHTLPPAHTGVQSVHVSALRFILVTRLTEGSVSVGNCEADGGSV